MILSLALSLTMLWATPVFAVTWLPFGPDGGDARRIVPDPSDPSHLYLGTANGWIYESHNSGKNWTRLARVDKRDDLVLDSIVVDTSNPRHLIVGGYANTDGGLFISYNAGKTWTIQAEMRGQSIRSLAVSPTDPKDLVAGTLKGVFRSTDGGVRWKLISPPDSTEIHEVESVAIDPADPNIIYAGTWHLPWKTVDGGEHWANIKDGIIDDSDVFSIIVDPQSSKTVYASACSGIYKSEDAGLLFHKVQGIPSSARRTRVLMQDPNDLKIVFAGTTEGLWRSTDAGRTWSRTTGPEIIVNDVSIDKSDSHHVLIATDRGGVLSSDDGGDTFHPSNGGFSARQITSIKRDNQHPATILAGVVNDKEWGGVFRSADGGLSWSQRADGLQGRDVFSLGQAPDGTFIAGTAHGLYRLDASGEVWVRVENAPSGSGVAADGVKLPGIRLRGPVTVRRNQFAERNGARKTAAKGPQTTARHGTAPVSGKRKAPTKPIAGAQRRCSKPLKRGAVPPTAVAKVAAPSGEAPSAGNAAAALPLAVQPASKGFDGSVFGLATAGRSVLAITSIGLLASDDDGVTWTHSGPPRSEDWRFLAAAKNDVVSASLHSISFSADAGQSWAEVIVPEALTQISSVAVEPSGRIWVGGREGVFVSRDAGHNWMTPKNLFVNSVNSLFYDDSTNRMMVTTGGYSSLVFTVQLPDLQISFADTGWSLRFARPMGDHLIAATLFDGIVVQPRMVASPMADAAVKRTAESQPIVTERRTEPLQPVAVQQPDAVLGSNGVPVVVPVHLPTAPQ